MPFPSVGVPCFRQWPGHRRSRSARQALHAELTGALLIRSHRNFAASGIPVAVPKSWLRVDPGSNGGVMSSCVYSTSAPNAHHLSLSAATESAGTMSSLVDVCRYTGAEGGRASDLLIVDYCREFRLFGEDLREGFSVDGVIGTNEYPTMSARYPARIASHWS